MKQKYVMLIDMQACMGCNTCTIACKQENNLPEGVSWTKVITLDSSQEGFDLETNPNLAQDYLLLFCQHCTQAPCVEVCPRSATYRDPEGDWIMQDPTLCIGCRYCMMVCPYTSVRVFSGERLEFTLPYATGDNPIVHRPKTVEKCTFCAHRIKKNQQPACVEACPVSARIFGDLNEINSEVSELLRTRAHFQLLAEKGTEPRVYYLI